MKNEVLHQGIVNDYQEEKEKTLVSIAPLLSIFDTTMFYNRDLLQTGGIEQFLKKTFEDHYKTNEDVLQNIYGFSCETQSATPTYLNIKSNIHEMWDICSRALRLYNVAISAQINFQEKQFKVSIGRKEKANVIELNLKNVIDKQVTIGDTYGALNKSTYYSKDDENQKATYYLHKDSSISQKNENRVTPVFSNVEYIEGAENFLEEAMKRANEQLQPEDHNNCIEVTYSKNDKIARFSSFEVGQVVHVIDGEQEYFSIYTGYRKNGGTHTFIFGTVRVKLTDKLILQRRMNNAH